MLSNDRILIRSAAAVAPMHVLVLVSCVCVLLCTGVRISDDIYIDIRLQKAAFSVAESARVQLANFDENQRAEGTLDTAVLWILVVLVVFAIRMKASFGWTRLLL